MGRDWGASLLMETSFRFLDHNQLSGNGRGQVNEMREKTVTSHTDTEDTHECD